MVLRKEQGFSQCGAFLSVFHESIYCRTHFACLVEVVLIMHYANMSVQHTAIFHGCKNDNFQLTFFFMSFFFRLIFAQNIDCGYRLEPPH